MSAPTMGLPTVVNQMWELECGTDPHARAWKRTAPPTAVRVLIALLDAGEPLWVTELARRTGMGQGTASTVVHRLVERGLALAERDDVPGGHQGGGKPRRLVTATAAGRRIAIAARGAGVQAAA